MTDFFIAAPARSGGTLVYSILCADSKMPPVLMENHFIGMIASVYRVSKDRLRLEQGHFFSDLEDVQTFYRTCINTFLDKQRKRNAPAEHTAIKSTMLGSQCPIIHELMPNAILVMVIRDPRDIIASMISVGIKQERMGQDNLYPRNIDQLSNDLINHYRPTLACNAPGFQESMLYIKYEDVVSNPHHVVENLQKRTGLDLSGFDPENAWERSQRSFDESAIEKDAFMTDSYGKEISANSQGRFRSVLDADEIEHIERLFSPFMKQFQYS